MMFEDQVRRLSRSIYFNARVWLPSIQNSFTTAETPFDILVDFVNFWASITGVDMIKIDKVNIKQLLFLVTMYI